MDSRVIRAGAVAINMELRIAVTVRRPEKRKKLNMRTPDILTSIISMNDFNVGIGNFPSLQYRIGNSNIPARIYRRNVVVKGGKAAATILPATNDPPHKIGARTRLI